MFCSSGGIRVNSPQDFACLLKLRNNRKVFISVSRKLVIKAVICHRTLTGLQLLRFLHSNFLLDYYLPYVAVCCVWKCPLLVM